MNPQFEDLFPISYKVGNDLHDLISCNLVDSTTAHIAITDQESPVVRLTAKIQMTPLTP